MSKTPYLLLLFIICFLAVAMGAMDSVLSAAYLPDIMKDMGMNVNNPDQTIEGAWINFSFLAGGTVGGILFGLLADKLGRRLILSLSLLLYGLGSGAGALVHSVQLLSVTRFLVGMGVGTALVLSAVIISEIWNPRTKAVALGILAVAYPAGILGSGLITSSIEDWRTAFLIGAIPAVLAIGAFALVKETLVPASAQQMEKTSLFAHNKNLMPGILVYGTMLIGLWSAFSWLPTWVQTLLGDVSEKGQSQRGMAVMLLGMGGIVGSIISGWLMNKWGAKWMQGICFVVCFIISFWMFKLNTKFSTEVLVGSGLLGFFFGLSQGVLNAYIPQLFPARIRSSATALCFHTGRAFTAVAVFFVGAWVAQLGGYGNAIFIFSVVYIIGLIALLFIRRQPNT